MLFLNLEFLSISFLIVYVGAIAILFLFTLIVVSPELQITNKSTIKKKPLFFFLLLLLHFVTKSQNGISERFAYEMVSQLYLLGPRGGNFNQRELMLNASDILAFGLNLYTKYQFPF